MALRTISGDREIARLIAGAEASYAMNLMRMEGDGEGAVARMAKNALLAALEDDGPGHEFGHICCARTLRRLGEYWYSFDEAALAARLQYLFVAPRWRGMGYGAAALAAIHANLEKSGCKHIELNVFAANPHAMALYKSFGYVVDSCEMSRPLSPVLSREAAEDDLARDADGAHPSRRPDAR